MANWCSSHHSWWAVQRLNTGENCVLLLLLLLLRHGSRML
jgi:hypothetical protein